MKYQVPQFIEVEDKIFGPLTFKQFIYLAGGASVCFLAYRLLPLFIALFIIIPMASLSIALAFYKVNNRPFIVVMESALNYLIKEKLYIWKKEVKKAEEKKKEDSSAADFLVPKLSQSKLKDLTWSLDINETIYSREARKLQKGAGMMDKSTPF